LYSIVTAGLLLILLSPTLLFAHGGRLDDQGGHFNRKTGEYICHKEPCFSIQKQSKEAFEEADKLNAILDEIHDSLHANAEKKAA